MNFFKDPKYKLVRIILLLVIIIGAGWFVVGNMNQSNNNQGLVINQAPVKAPIPNTVSREDLIKLNLTDQKALYKSLPAEQKYSLWLDKINYLLANKDLAENQKSAFKSLKSSMSTDWFLDANRVSAQQKITDWTSQNQNIFSQEEIISFLSNLQNNGNPTPPAKPQVGKPDCTCKRDPNSYSCQTYPPCNETSWGCGFLWLSGCNGLPFYYNSSN
jgi:hypothetical protein